MKYAVLMLAASCAVLPARAAPLAAPGGPALDLDIGYYSIVRTPEGVTREARYAEKMVRRPGHVWVARILPKHAGGHHDEPDAAGSGHKHFNHALMARHVTLENNTLSVEYIDAHRKAVVAIPASEYGNVNFDGSWANAFFLLDPSLLKAMAPSGRHSSIPGAQWREREKNGMFERVLWDEQKKIPLVIESGDKAATFFRRVEVKPQAVLARKSPWEKLDGFARQEYSDFLD